jgi:hypothetical protein
LVVALLLAALLDVVLFPFSALFVSALLVVALLLAALFDVELFPFSALFPFSVLFVSALFVVAHLLAALLLVALVFASCFGVWFFKVVPAVCHCDPPFISRSESTPFDH